jgi:hypothetical protein
LNSQIDGLQQPAILRESKKDPHPRKIGSKGGAWKEVSGFGIGLT